MERNKSLSISPIGRLGMVDRPGDKMYEEIRILDHGFIRLIDTNGSDLSVVNAARVSVQVRHEEIEEGDAGLIKFLMREHHGTPFEHNSFTFHVKAPLFVFREWHRHRVGHSYNELSGRYKQFENPDFYFPAREDMRMQTGTPGHYTFEQWQGNYKQIQALSLRHYQDSVDLYEYMIDHKVAKEVARLVLPVALYSEMYWTCNARSLMNFLALRNAENAMFEIREYAKAAEEIFSEVMPVTAQAWSEVRVSP